MGPKKKELVASKRHRADELVARLKKNDDKRDVYCASDLMKNWRYIDFINPALNMPTLALEWFFGGRGLLAGRITKLQAKYGVGKSSFMWLVYASAQAFDSYCYHIESEAAPPPPDFIWSFGCDPSKLVTEQPKSLEQCLEFIDQVVAEIRGGMGGGINPATGRQQKTKFTDPLDPNMEVPIVIGVDSVSALGLETAVETDILDMRSSAALAKHSRIIGEYFRNRSDRFKQTQSLIMMAAQEKAVINTGGPFAHAAGNKSTSTLADSPIGFHSTYVVEMRNNKYVDKSTGTDLGERITCFTTKNKLSPKHRTIELYLVRDRGFDLVKTDMDFLVSHPASPLAGSIGRSSHGVKSDLVDNAKWYKDDIEFLRKFYTNEDLVMTCREKLRIRGFEFAFETKYMPSKEEIEDNKQSAESDLHGVEGSAGKIPPGKNTD